MSRSAMQRVFSYDRLIFWLEHVTHEIEGTVATLTPEDNDEQALLHRGGSNMLLGLRAVRQARAKAMESCPLELQLEASIELVNQSPERMKRLNR